jgi:hypothetical protein
MTKRTYGILAAVVFALFLILVLCTSCVQRVDPEEDESTHKHLLRKFNVKTSTSSGSSAWYFLVAGGYSSHDYRETNVRFYFLNCRDEYQFMELPLNNVRIQIDSVQHPYATFTMDRKYNSRCFDVHILPGTYIDNVTIHCNESDFQPEININDLK